MGDFPGHPVTKNPFANAGDRGQGFQSLVGELDPTYLGATKAVCQNY